jgi:RNA-directed DNA polymerase
VAPQKLSRSNGFKLLLSNARRHARFYPSALYRLLARINAYLVRWIRNKYRRYDATRAARAKLAEITDRYPRIFAHWRWVTTAW